MCRKEGNSGISITGFLLRLILIIIFIFLLIWLYPMPNLTNYYSSAFGNNINTMKDAAQSYYTNEKLPKIDGDSVRMTLQEMLDQKLLIPFVDSKGKSCDTEHSYVEVIKDGNEYLMKIYLSCNDESDYVVVPMGCYDKCGNSCDGKLCTILYKYKQTVSKTKKVNTCPKGYKLKSGKCIKTTTTYDIISAKTEKTNDTYKCSDGSTPVNGICTAKLVTIKTYVPQQLVNYTEQVEVQKKCNCKTQTVNTCASISGCYNYVTKTVCATCTETETVNKTKTIAAYYKYSCPAGTTKQTGSDATLTCYKETAAEKVVGDTVYSCESGYSLTKDNKCSKAITNTNTTKANTKKVSYKETNYKWSALPALEGWTKTNEVKKSCK